VDILLFPSLLLATAAAIYFAITAAGARQTLGETNRAQHTATALSQQLAILQDYAQRTHRTLGETTAALTQQLAAAQAYAQRLRRYETTPDAETAAPHQAEQSAPPTKNILEGYADRHVLPTARLLDDLAEQLAFAEAGQKLCPPRAKTRSRISDGAEQQRKLEPAVETAAEAVETAA
jgi:hypothetical protein